MKINKYINLTLLVLSVFIIPSIGFAKTLYVDPNGNDSVTYTNNSQSTPWRTIGRAAWGSVDRTTANSSEAAKSGDIVVVNSGTYSTSGTNLRMNPSYNPVNNGSANNPIIFRANGEVILTLGSGQGPLIGANSRSYITWDGFTINGINAPSTSDTGHVDVYNSDHITLSNLKITGDINHPQTNQGNYNGIRIEASNFTHVFNNRLRSFATAGVYGSNETAITMYDSNDSVIENNTIDDTAVGIFVKGIHPGSTQARNVIRNNYIFGLNRSSSPIGIRLLGSQNTKVYKNIITDARGTDGNGTGINLSCISSDCSNQPKNDIVSNNTIVNSDTCVSLGITSSTWVDFKFNNNICQGGRYGVYSDYFNLIPTTNTSFNYNVYNGQSISVSNIAGNKNLSQWQLSGHDLNSVNINPLFVSNTDFNLQTSSPVKNIAIDLLDLNNNGLVTDTIPAGAYITGSEVIGISGSAVITPPPVLLTPTADIKVNAGDSTISVNSGNSVTISWTSTNTTLCTVSPSGFTGISGSQTVTPSVNTTYTISCSGSGGTASDSVSVNINSVTPTPTNTDEWVFCANENGTCSFSGTKEVRYGAQNTYSTRTATGSIACNNDVFGDPILNVVKQCQYKVSTTTTPVTPVVTVPSAPTNLSAVQSGTSQVNLSWSDASSNESGFRVERKTGASGVYSEIATLGSNITSYQNTGLNSSTQYYFRVRSYNSAGNSSYSNEAFATTEAPIINNPATSTPPVVDVKIKVGDRVQTTARVNVRSTPNGRRLGTQSNGMQGIVTEGPASASGSSWYKVNFNSGVDGWVISNYVSKVSTTTLSIEEIRNSIASLLMLVQQLQEQLSKIK